MAGEFASLSSSIDRSTEVAKLSCNMVDPSYWRLFWSLMYAKYSVSGACAGHTGRRRFGPNTSRCWSILWEI